MAGISLSRVNITNRFRGSSNIVLIGTDFPVFWNEQVLESHFTIPALHLRAGFDYYLLTELSIYAQVEGILMPSVTKNTNLLALDPFPREPVGLLSHKVNSSAVQILAGVRFHLAPRII